MLVLIWATLLFFMRGGKTHPGGKEHYQNKYCIIAVQAGPICHISGNTGDQTSLLTYNLTAKCNGSWVTCKVSFKDNRTNVNVACAKDSDVTGEISVKVGDAPPLNCSVEQFRPSTIPCTKLGSNNRLGNESKTNLLIENPIVFIFNLTSEQSGQYTCTAKYLNISLTMSVKVTVTSNPKTPIESSCINQSKFLICVCISEGFSLSTIKWPLLENQTEYSVITTVSNNTVISTLILSVKDHSFSTVKCVISNGEGNETENLIKKNQASKQEDLLEKLKKTIIQLPVILAFLIGILLATLCCLPIKCRRKKQRKSVNLAEDLEMNPQGVSQIDNDQAVEEEDGTHDQEAAEEGAEAAGQSVPCGDMELKEVEYSDITFSVLKRKSPTGAEERQEPMETEYAEIKKEATRERQDNGDEGEVLEGNGEEEAMIGEDWETEQCVPAEEGAEAAALYSNMNEITTEA